MCPPVSENQPPIFLLTDFGTQDPFVGIMKAVMLKTGATGPFIDLTHEVFPQDIVSGSIYLEDSLHWLPDASITIAVVDPGVGSERRPLCLKRGLQYFIAPDNGILNPLFNLEGTELREIPDRDPIDYRKSTTFHGRDVFAPAAAALACGKLAFSDFGTDITDPVRLSPPLLEVIDGNRMELTIIHVDRFGNLVTNLKKKDLPKNMDLKRGRFQSGSLPLGTLKRTFSDVQKGSPLVYFNSAGRLEVAVSMGNASNQLKLEIGDVIIFDPADSGESE